MVINVAMLAKLLYMMKQSMEIVKLVVSDVNVRIVGLKIGRIVGLKIDRIVGLKISLTITSIITGIATEEIPELPRE